MSKGLFVAASVLAAVPLGMTSPAVADPSNPGVPAQLE
jgi:hypothetical protein